LKRKEFPLNASTVPGLEGRGRFLTRLSSRSALFTDFRILLDQTVNRTRQGFYQSVVCDNILSRKTKSSSIKIFNELKYRYTLNEESPIFSVFLREWDLANSDDSRSLLGYVLLALNDLTVMRTSCEWLFQYLRKPGSELRVVDLDAYFKKLMIGNHSEISCWSQETRLRVERHYLASIRDFGLATGSNKKFSVKPALYSAPVRLLIQALLLSGADSSAIIRHEAFKILGIAPNEVIDTLYELHRQGSLHFRMQADIVELSL
jgi:hypothetical protein